MESHTHLTLGLNGEPHPNYRMPDGNIHFDARKGIGNWIAPDFDDSSWPQALTLDIPHVAHWNKLVERPIPLWKVEMLTKYEMMPNCRRSVMESLLSSNYPET